MASGWPRRRLFVAVRSAARTAQIGRAAVIFRKKPFYFSENNPRSKAPPRIFCKKLLILFGNQPAVQNGWPPGFLQKTLIFLENQPALHKPLTIFAKPSSDFSQINIQANFDYIFFPTKKYVWPVDRAHGRARITSIVSGEANEDHDMVMVMSW